MKLSKKTPHHTFKMLISVFFSLLTLMSFIYLFILCKELYDSGFFTFIDKAPIVFDKHQQSALNKLYSENLIEITFYSAISLVFLAIAVSSIFKLKASLLWEDSWIVSIIFVVATAVICYLSIAYRFNEDMERIITTQEELDAFKTETIEDFKINDYSEPIFIKTGIFIQNVEFSSANNIIVTGYIWQKYYAKDTTGVNSWVRKGFVMPESENMEAELAYRRVYEKEGYEVIGWDVEITLREIFNYSRYPFDLQNLWLRIWHKDFDKNVVLIPDLEAYASEKADTKFETENKLGIENSIELSGWEIIETFFGYKRNSYSTNFGIADYTGQQNFPELYYCILVQRHFITVFIVEMIPIFMVTFILFVTIYVAYDEAQDAFFRFNIMELLSLCATLIFVILLVQIDLRRKISTTGVLYIEYYYFTMYLSIFAILGDYIIINIYKNSKSIFNYGDNIWIKTFFLPIITGIVLVATYFTFK